MNTNFCSIKDDGSLEVMIGSTIDNTIEEASDLARGWAELLIDDKCFSGKPVKFIFNDVTVIVESNSHLGLLLRDWNRAMSGYLGDDPVVGPHPKAELSKEELAKDAEIEAANKARRDEEAAQSLAAAKAHRERVEARMQNAPAMEFSNAETWLAAKTVNENTPYGVGTLSYAERWARMMQLEISEGKTLEQVWNSTSYEADLEGMSGYSQGAATHLLTQSWIHGAELRRLHNAYWGSDSTEGTVNPAIIRID